MWCGIGCSVSLRIFIDVVILYKLFSDYICIYVRLYIYVGVYVMYTTCLSYLSMDHNIVLSIYLSVRSAHKIFHLYKISHILLNITMICLYLVRWSLCILYVYIATINAKIFLYRSELGKRTNLFICSFNPL